MFTATVPVDGGALSELPGGGELARLLDSAHRLDPAQRQGSAEPAQMLLPCRTHHDPDLWFADSPADLEQAKGLCADCPVKADCLASALSRAEPWGVWGGEIFERGTVIARKRPRGRPSKAALAAERAEQAQATAPQGGRGAAA